MSNKTKLQSCLLSLDEQEKTSFKRYLKLNKGLRNENIEKLYQYYSDQNFEDVNSVNDRLVFRKVNMTGKFTERSINRLVSTLLELVQDYFVVKVVSYENFDKKIVLLKQLYERHLFDLFSKQLESIEKDFENLEIKYENDYLNLYNVFTLKFDYLSNLNKFNKYENELNELNQIRKYYHLAYHYIITLRMIALDLNQNYLIRSKKDKLEVEETLKIVRELELQAVPIIDAYANTIYSFSNIENEPQFYNLLEYLENRKFKDSEDEKYLFDFALNYCVLKISTGSNSYYQLYFKLNKLILEVPLFYTSGYLFDDTIKNIVIIGLRCGELDWVEYFLETYDDKFQPKRKEVLQNYCYAILYFHQKKYSESLDKLGGVPLETEHFKLPIRANYVKLYYETKNDSLITEMKLFNEFLLNNNKNGSITEFQLNQYKSFISITKKLNNTFKSEKGKLIKVMEKINNTSPLAERPWLLEKVKEKIGKVKS